ncbi:MAG: hypothetical protein AB1730_18975 [Myxococcota bacterium]
MGLFFVAWLLSAAPAPAMVGRCKPGAVDTEAQGLLETLGAALEAGDAERLKVAWGAVKAHTCFALPLHETFREPPDDDVEAFQAWWARGGRDWLASGLSNFGNEAFTVVPPDAPKRPEPGKAAGLERLACPKGAPDTCARETAGWVLRAAEALEPREDRHDDSERKATEVACAAEAKKATKPNAYRAWRECLERKRPQGAALPLGRYQAPKDGWLVLRGRRGHYQFCDEVRAYDLSTGAAWVAQSCSGLVLQQGGRVDHDATDAQRGLTVRVGRLPLEALREAAWMTLLAAHVSDHVQPWAWFVRRPAGLEPAWPDDDAVHGIGLGSFWGSSAQTTLAWSWQGAEGLRDAGTLTWPDSASAGENHAAALWRIAEAAFLEGCAPARLARQLVVGKKPGVSGLDAKRSSLDAVEKRLLEALSGQPDGCADAGR